MVFARVTKHKNKTFTNIPSFVDAIKNTVNIFKWGLLQKLTDIKISIFILIVKRVKSSTYFIAEENEREN